MDRLKTERLAKAVRARRDAEITRRLDELFADSELAAEQRLSAEAFAAAGTDWENERW